MNLYYLSSLICQPSYSMPKKDFSNIYMDEHMGLEGFLQCRKTEDKKVEIPASLCNWYVHLGEEEETERVDTISVPIITNYRDAFNTNSSVILRTVFSTNSNRNSRLLSFGVSNKPYIYYGGEGMLIKKMGEVRTLLLMHTITLERKDDTDSPDSPDFKVSSVNLRISPEVFKCEDVVSKYIVRKLIPYLCKNCTPDSLRQYRKLPNIIIGDLSDWILTPVKPDISTFEQDFKEFFAREDVINEVLNCL